LGYSDRVVPAAEGVFENGQRPSSTRADPTTGEQERIEYLEKKIQIKDEVLAELMAEHIALKKSSWGTLTGVWVPHDVSDQLWILSGAGREGRDRRPGGCIEWLSIQPASSIDWRERYGQTNEHNGWFPRDFWLEQWEKEAIVDFHLKNPLEVTRRLTL